MRLKFVSLNLWRGGILFNEAVEFLKKEKADILALQEVYNGENVSLPNNFQTIKQFEKIFSYKYFYYSPAFLEKTEYGLIDNGNAIFSKFPIAATKTKFVDFFYRKRKVQTQYDFLNTPRNLQAADINLGKILLHIYNFHGIWGTDGKDSPRRLRMGKVIAEEIKDKKNVVLAGDFNMESGTKTIGGIEKYLLNIFKDKIKSTFNMKRKTNKILAKIVVDMIFVSQDIKVIDFYCPKVDISDHLPLVVILEAR